MHASYRPKISHVAKHSICLLIDSKCSNNIGREESIKRALRDVFILPYLYTSYSNECTYCICAPFFPANPNPATQKYTSSFVYNVCL